MIRPKGQALSIHKRETRAIGLAHGIKVTPRAKDVVMSMLYAMNRPMCPYEIFEEAVYFGLLSGTDMHPNTINVACTHLEAEGHIVSTGERGLGAGWKPSTCMVLAWQHRVNGPDPKVYRKRGTIEPYPAETKRQIKRAQKNPQLWTEALRQQSWERAFELMLAEMAMEEGSDF